MTASLAGSRVLITGASSGIGRALARRLSDEGTLLAVAARRESLLRSLAAEMQASGRPAPHVLPADLACPGAAATLAAEATAALGGIDILVNNAGTPLIGSGVSLGDDDQARALFELHVWAPLALTRALLPAMCEQGRGTIVNVTSTLQAVPLPFTGYYGASKAALALLTRTLRLELTDTPVRVIEVSPGSTDTALRDLDGLPWRTRPPALAPRPVSAESVAAATTRALKRQHRRLVHPRYAAVPLELPAVGRLVAHFAARRMDTDTFVLGRPASAADNG